MDDERDSSLIDRAVQRLSPPATPRAAPVLPKIDWRFATALAALIALGPLLTIVGAGLLERSAQAEAGRLRTRAAPQINALAADREARDLLRAAVREAPVAVWLDRAAQALPADARISRMARTADGRFEIDVTAPDPDLLRGAIRRNPAFAGFRETGQRRAGAMILITYRRAA
ncbi:hypothetical protein M9978_16140 [Sphingomonas sp. MG17]|uniref:Uncharacterized protein n=1 Tax=Sphingomonas tagetis TaxID=2949092 RepID=A0A9X2HIS1_9SPHN|nr:hypothetical protein [Sphingomonas tagetis]MCP3731956.1 hypothetical protein [Sphingomonas tagetis]